MDRWTRVTVNLGDLTVRLDLGPYMERHYPWGYFGALGREN